MPRTAFGFNFLKMLWWARHRASLSAARPNRPTPLTSFMASQKKTHNNNSHNRCDIPRHSPSPARLPLAAAFILQCGTHLVAGTATPSPATCSSVGAPRRAIVHLPDHRCRLHYGCRRSSGAMQPLTTGRAAPAHYHPPSPPRPTSDLALHAPRVLGFAQSTYCKHMF
jgi:hypothetical protein